MHGSILRRLWRSARCSLLPDAPFAAPARRTATNAPLCHTRRQLFGDSVDAHLAYEWCSLLQQPLKLTPTGLRGSVAALAAAVSSKANAAAAGLTSGGGNTSSSSSSSSGRDGGSSAAAPQATPTDAHSCCKNRDRFYHCAPGKPDAANSVSIAMYHLLGVHLNGPYHTGQWRLVSACRRIVRGRCCACHHWVATAPRCCRCPRCPRWCRCCLQARPGTSSRAYRPP
jgi:hypothetical protein